MKQLYWIFNGVMYVSSRFDTNINISNTMSGSGLFASTKLLSFKVLVQSHTFQILVPVQREVYRSFFPQIAHFSSVVVLSHEYVDMYIQY
jgi:hypothetical protein